MNNHTSPFLKQRNIIATLGVVFLFLHAPIVFSGFPERDDSPVFYPLSPETHHSRNPERGRQPIPQNPSRPQNNVVAPLTLRNLFYAVRGGTYFAVTSAIFESYKTERCNLDMAAFLNNQKKLLQIAKVLCSRNKNSRKKAIRALQKFISSQNRVYAPQIGATMKLALKTCIAELPSMGISAVDGYFQNAFRKKSKKFLLSTLMQHIIGCLSTGYILQILDDEFNAILIRYMVKHRTTLVELLTECAKARESNDEDLMEYTELELKSFLAAAYNDVGSAFSLMFNPASSHPSLTKKLWLKAIINTLGFFAGKAFETFAAPKLGIS